MIRIENDCCDCAVPGYPCLGSICSLRHVPHCYCDMCGEEISEFDINEDYHLCEDCKEEA